MNEADRIRLAEAMGYHWLEDKRIKEWPGMGHWYAPNGDRLPHLGERVRGCGHGVPPTFDPYTDANDCDALIRHLNERNLTVHISMVSGLHVVTVDALQWEGDDYKQGVCELALKVGDNEVLQEGES